MTITLFVSPDSLMIFLQVTRILRTLDIENDYVFTPSDIQYSEAMISNYVWINMDIEEYLKFTYCMCKLKAKQS